MATQEKLRKSVLNRVRNLSEDKLQRLDVFLDDMDYSSPSNKSPLAYSGIFAELELEDLTSNLHQARKDSSNRIAEF